MTSNLRRLTALGLALAAAALAWPTMAVAQGFPNRPIRLVVPWPAGTPADVSGRIVAERMAQGLGQPIVVDNRPGAGGTVGMAEALRQPADGYTIYMLSSASLVSPLLFPAQALEAQYKM